MLSARGVAPASPPLPPLLPLTFSLQPQVLQLEYLYADALSTCSSCFPSFTFVPLRPLPRTLPLSLSPPLSLSLVAPFPLPFSLCSHNLCSLQELIPARETAAYLFLWVLAYSTTLPRVLLSPAPVPPLFPLQPYPNRVDWSKRLLLRLSWILALDSVDLAQSPFVLHCDTHTHTQTLVSACVCVCFVINLT